MKSIFVSRSLDADSPIRKVVEGQAVQLVDESLISFTKVAWEVPETRWLFFYSKTGVRIFNERCPSHHYKVLTYGRATAALHSRYGAVVAHADADTSRAIGLLDIFDCKDDITFVCGRLSLRSVHGHPSLRGYDLPECVVYDQHVREDISSESYDLAVITSPLNYASFAKAGRKASVYLSIGSTTAAALQAEGVESMIAASPSEAGIATTLSNWLAR